MNYLWPIAKGFDHLRKGEVHVWCAGLDSVQFNLVQLKAILNNSELERAARFHFEADRRNFILRRGILRHLLGIYLNLSPAEIQYSINQYGKPALDGIIDNEVNFNVSISREIALFAFARAHRVGVDIERHRGDLEFNSIVRNFFTSREQAEFSQLPDSRRLEGFFNCWTRKEAVIKALGLGLSLPLDSFDVTLTPEKPVRILEARGRAKAAFQLRLQELTPAVGYSAALAVDGADWHAFCRQFEPACIWDI